MARSALLARIAADRSGVALTEFAISAPFLILLYLGTYQVGDAVSCNRKVTMSTRAVADLTSQYSSVSNSSLDSILGASAQVMAPYAIAQASIRVSEVYTNGTVTTVQWSRTLGSSITPYCRNTVIAANAKLVSSGTYSIIAETLYSYKPAANFGIVGPLALKETIYMRPRLSSRVDNVDQTATSPAVIPCATA